jgi:hypothetical protein
MAFVLLALAALAADPPTAGDVIDAAHRAGRPPALPLLNKVQVTPPGLRVGGLDIQVRGVGGPYERLLHAALVGLGAAPAPGTGGLLLVRDVTPPPPPPAHVGTWVREKDGSRLTLTFTDRRLRVDGTAADGKPFRLDADYAVSPDGVAFGVVTAAEPADELAGELFKFKLRVDDGELTVREPRLTADGFEAKRMTGRYARADPRLPPPKK